MSQQYDTFSELLPRVGVVNTTSGRGNCGLLRTVATGRLSQRLVQSLSRVEFSAYRLSACVGRKAYIHASACCCTAVELRGSRQELRIGKGHMEEVLEYALA